MNRPEGSQAGQVRGTGNNNVEGGLWWEPDSRRLHLRKARLPRCPETFQKCLPGGWLGWRLLPLPSAVHHSPPQEEHTLGRSST